jgi:hypothetical protein
MNNALPDNLKFVVSHGTVQPYIVRRGDKQTSMIMIHFGLSEYDRRKPVLTNEARLKAQAVCDALNSSEIDLNEARTRLQTIW